MSSPSNESPSDAATPSSPLSEEKGGTRILIVDDDDLVRGLFCAYLSERYECATASNFDEALALLQSKEFTLVLSDMIMPGRSGIELLREINSRFLDTVVIIVSGINRTQRVLDAVRLGAYDYLVKPCELDVLGMTIERALEHRTLIRNSRQYKIDLERSNAELRQSKAELEHRKSELERLQAQIVHAEKMASLGQLAAGVAHELNNPAGFIFGNMDVLKECAQGLERLLNFYERTSLNESERAEAALIKDEIDYANALEDLRSIIIDCRDGAERIRDVVQNLCTFSHLGEAEFKKVDIHEGLDSTIRLLSRFYTSGHIKLRREYSELPPVDCYAGQLNQVWMNLLANAAHAVKDGGEVSVKTGYEGDRVVVTISDTGCGIPPEAMKRIFDPFFTTKPIGEGTGLGLSVTYSIIERHKGTISVESQSGIGTTFTISIPVDSQPAEEESSDTTTEPAYIYRNKEHS
ncbi:MAG TPA: ATP-binding protein [Pyrinomonadaceae bacterium]|nr:ATP-binding protein [Pyrinomonadaceae bacterium]